LEYLGFLENWKIIESSIFCKSWKTGNWNILGILKNWKLEYFANPGKLVIGIFGILGKLENYRIFYFLQILENW